ncbi:exonuclease subunit SbcD [Candidatus Woesearchaeota archaeon]|nr:exonuclease subunit SbcD [Candidatus Woesearchaeota archaeon]
MRLLHTSDWHLGQTFHGHDRRYEHQCFLDWLLETLDQEQTDALLIAGDIFDNANPSATALHQFYRFIRDAKTRLPSLDVVIIAGNHDSPFRLEAPSPLLTVMGVSVVGQVSRFESQAIDPDRLVLPLCDRTGQVAAWCLAVPFLRSGDLPRRDPDEPLSVGYAQAVAGLYGQVQAVAEAKRAKEQPLIALGHCHLQGGEVSIDSERRLVIGGSEALPVSIFGQDLAYVALGHLHRAQCVGGEESRRYSGSPLPLSFSETGYRHQVVRVDLANHQVRDIQVLPVPRAVELLRIPEQPLETVLKTLEALERPTLPLERQPYLDIRVRLDQPEPGLRHRIETALQGKPVRLTRIEPRYPAHPAGKTEAVSAPTLEDIGRLEPRDVFMRLYRQRYSSEPDDALCTAFNELLESLP